MSGKRRIWWQAFLLLLLAGAISLSWRAIHQHLVVAQCIPPRPSLGNFPVELEDGIARAEGDAKGYIHTVRGLTALSRIYHANGYYDEAMQCYDGLRRLEPGEGRWPHLQASILTTFGRLDEALPLLQHAVVLAPRYVPSHLRLGDILLKTNRPDLAEKAYNEALGLDPGNAFALLGLARCAITRGDWSKAREQLQESIRLHANFIGGLSLLVVVAEHFGDQNEADALKEMIGRQEFIDLPDPWLDGLTEDCYDPYRLSVAAVVVNFSGDGPAARRLLERAIALAPETGSYHRQLGQMLFESRDYVSARRQLESAVTLSPYDPYSWTLLLKIMTAMGETEAIERVLANALANCPQSPELHLERARRFSSAHDPDDAIAEFREAYRLWPSEAGPLVELAKEYFTVNKTNEALAALREALQRQPEYPMALAALAFYYIEVGDEANALAWWEHVRRQSRMPPQTVAALKNAFQQHFGRDLQ